MGRRHIIVEGMDGSGKDTLIADLQRLFPGHALHKRASTSLGGPVADLAVWTGLDVRTMPDQPPSIYNRHPLVSEPIYAPRRWVNPGLKPPWNNEPWVAAYRRIAAYHAVLVVCQPPQHVVSENLSRSGADAHMPGVYDNQVNLYADYAMLTWPGAMIRYNYTMDTPETLARLIRNTYDWQED